MGYDLKVEQQNDHVGYAQGYDGLGSGNAIHGEWSFTLTGVLMVTVMITRMVPGAQQMDANNRVSLLPNLFLSKCIS